MALCNLIIAGNHETFSGNEDKDMKLFHHKYKAIYGICPKPESEDIYMRQITSIHFTSKMCHFQHSKNLPKNNYEFMLYLFV